MSYISSEIKSVYKGDNNIAKIYYGDILVFPIPVIEFETFTKQVTRNILKPTTIGNVEDIPANIIQIKGNTFVFNQLFETIGSEVTPIEGSTYLLQIDGVRSIVAATSETSNFVSTTATDMCINLRHLYGANPNNFPLTIAQFEEFFPLSYYAYEPGRIINMAITSFSSTGTHKDGTTFESVVNLPITTMTGKLDGTGDSVVIFPNGMGHAYGNPGAHAAFGVDYISKVNGVWQAVSKTHFATLNLANYSWTNSGYNSKIHKFDTTIIPLSINDTSRLSVVCDKFLSGRYRSGVNQTIHEMVVYSNEGKTWISISRNLTSLPIVNIAYPKNTASTYVLDDEYQTILNNAFSTNTGAIESVLPQNTATPVTAPLGISINYTVIDYEVKNICVSNWGGNIIPNEITVAEAAAVTTLVPEGGSQSAFRGNTTITRFNELRYFTGLTTLNYAFYGCTNLSEVTFPEATLTAAAGAILYIFGNGTKMKIIDFRPLKFSSNTGIYLRPFDPSTNTSYKSSVQEIYFPKCYVSSIYYMVGYCSNLTKIDMSLTNLKNMASTVGSVSSTVSAFANCTKLTTIVGGLPNTKQAVPLGTCSALTHDSALAVLNSLGTRTSGSATVTFHKNVHLTADEVAIGTAKGFTVTGHTLDS